ncbi:TIGR03013 family XrtA/PEP-CTERM system glycosyltransferase [Luteimonas sp. MJ246]|uniref:TIGR03013 family XrtA/PEP-CTERM system glycosyltransferase n=1 Tax=Luteimonas sp. MJ174 TaxID=3129237 RepID=UPI0031BBAD3F
MIGVFGSRANQVARWLWIGESLLVVLAVVAAIWLRFPDDPAGRELLFERGPVPALLVSVFVTMSMAAFGLYQAHIRLSRSELLLRLLLAFCFGGIALLVLYYLMPSTYIGRGLLAITLALGFAGVYGLRVVVQRLMRGEAYKRRVLVYGAGRNADLINCRMRRRADRQSFAVLGFLPVPGQEVVVSAALCLDVEESLPALVQRLGVHEIVVAPDERRGGLPMEDILACAQRGVSVVNLPAFFEREAGMIKLEVVDPSSLVFSGGFDHSFIRRLSKRAFDLAAALVLLLVGWPAMLLVALAVRLEDGGPALYRQVRVGEGGRSFELAKFRSMRTDAEKDGVAQWASSNDDRTTRVGRFIRKTRLDELPQLFNVLTGDMSFVGPRPERPQFVDQFNDEIRYYRVRHSVKPGLTGWAQLRYPYGASAADAHEKLKFDLFYVKNHGLLFDFLILLQTVEVVLFGRGAR